MGRVLRSVAVGLIATAVDLLLLAVMVDLFALTPRIANVPALLGGVGAQFVGNKLFAFRDRSSAWVRQGFLFSAVEVGALALNALLFDRLVAFGVGYVAARIVGSMVVYLGFSLPLWSRIFRPAEVTG